MANQESGVPGGWGAKESSGRTGESSGGSTKPRYVQQTTPTGGTITVDTQTGSKSGDVYKTPGVEVVRTGSRDTGYVSQVTPKTEIITPIVSQETVIKPITPFTEIPSGELGTIQRFGSQTYKVTPKEQPIKIPTPLSPQGRVEYLVEKGTSLAQSIQSEFGSKIIPGAKPPIHGEIQRFGGVQDTRNIFTGTPEEFARLQGQIGKLEQIQRQISPLEQQIKDIQAVKEQTYQFETGVPLVRRTYEGSLTATIPKYSILGIPFGEVKPEAGKLYKLPTLFGITQEYDVEGAIPTRKVSETDITRLEIGALGAMLGTPRGVFATSGELFRGVRFISEGRAAASTTESISNIGKVTKGVDPITGEQYGKIVSDVDITGAGRFSDFGKPPERPPTTFETWKKSGSGYSSEFDARTYERLSDISTRPQTSFTGKTLTSSQRAQLEKIANLEIGATGGEKIAAQTVLERRMTELGAIKTENIPQTAFGFKGSKFSEGIYGEKSIVYKPIKTESVVGDINIYKKDIISQKPVEESPLTIASTVEPIPQTIGTTQLIYGEVKPTTIESFTKTKLEGVKVPSLEDVLAGKKTPKEFDFGKVVSGRSGAVATSGSRMRTYTEQKKTSKFIESSTLGLGRTTIKPTEGVGLRKFKKTSTELVGEDLDVILKTPPGAVVPKTQVQTLTGIKPSVITKTTERSLTGTTIRDLTGTKTGSITKVKTSDLVRTKIGELTQIKTGELVSVKTGSLIGVKTRDLVKVDTGILTKVKTDTLTDIGFKDIIRTEPPRVDFFKYTPTKFNKPPIPPIKIPTGKTDDGGFGVPTRGRGRGYTQSYILNPLDAKANPFFNGNKAPRGTPKIATSLISPISIPLGKFELKVKEKPIKFTKGKSKKKLFFEL